jgi:hypothetical protein
MSQRDYSRRDREILLDTTMRLYAVRRPAIPYTKENDIELVENCISDAFDLAIPLLFSPVQTIETPPPGSIN